MECSDGASVERRARRPRTGEYLGCAAGAADRASDTEGHLPFQGSLPWPIARRRGPDEPAHSEAAAGAKIRGPQAPRRDSVDVHLGCTGPVAATGRSLHDGSASGENPRALADAARLRAFELREAH